MPITRITGLLGLILLASCASPPSAGINGPTGRAGDTRNISAVTVRDTWKLDLEGQSKELVTRKLPYSQTARFDNNVRFDGYYDARHDVTRIGVYGNVNSHSDYGTTYNNGYYVTWEETGRADNNFPAPWRLVDIEVLDQQF